MLLVDPLGSMSLECRASGADSPSESPRLGFGTVRAERSPQPAPSGALLDEVIRTHARIARAVCARLTRPDGLDRGKDGT